MEVKIYIITYSQTLIPVSQFLTIWFWKFATNLALEEVHYFLPDGLLMGNEEIVTSCVFTLRYGYREKYYKDNCHNEHTL